MDGVATRCAITRSGWRRPARRAGSLHPLRPPTPPTTPATPAPRPQSRLRRGLRWVPNALTMGRLAALPVMGAVLAAAEGPTSTRAAWLFAGIGMTDFIDGRLARALNAESTFGRLADPLADRLLVAVGLVGLIALHRLNPVGPLAVLFRDLVAVVGAIALRNRGLDLRVDMLGKTSSALVMAGIALTMVSEAPWTDAVFWTGVALSMAAFANYARTVSRALGSETAAPGPSTPG